MTSSNKKDIFKEIMRNYPTGVTIVTTINPSNHQPVGLTINSFTSVSLDPTLVLFCVDKASSSLSSFRDSGKFAIHVLASDQVKVCNVFASKNTNKFDLANYKISDRGLPIVESALGVMECKLINEIEAGDHFIFVGEVEHISLCQKEPLLYFRGKTGAISNEWVCS
ncbi:flavin reductase family protein [Neobacillus rhizophilus]|uniref:Flavin reductase family protein n=1 Tax=Neobacillus rhizophilus TaxID=2833579 RepID=A0A942YWN6_9BACI|nr:flavin reductase family protein [Neobacillus rhizophilus]MBS4215172.1 flavin reductase family protein [Neobacillus rhizophilus]